MQNVPREDRLAFWAFTSASSTFNEARSCLHELGKVGGVQDNHLRHALVCTFVVLYGRPFKQKKNARFIEPLVPERMKSLHEHLLKLRDKTFAHVDPDGPDVKAGVRNRCRIQARGGGFACEWNYFKLSEAAQKEAEKLLLELDRKCKYHTVKIWKRYLGKNSAPDGDYEVSLDVEPSPLLKPWMPM